MVRIKETVTGWDVLLNGALYASCDTVEMAEREAKNARRSVRYGA